MTLRSNLRRSGLPSLLLTTLLLAAGASAAPATTPDEVLDALHVRASLADYDGYFALYAQDAVFLGTDASERWPIDEFRRYTKARFDTGIGWTYEPVERHLMRSGDVIWFDEIVEGEKLGPCRGTGVLVREDGAWKIAHYSLTLLVPNEVVEDVVAIGAAAADGG